MAPAAFALGPDEALDVCSDAEKDLPWVSWYLDDGTVVGPLDKVAAYTQCLVPALAQVGLQVNFRKSLWDPGVQREGDMVDQITDEVPLGHPVRAIPVVPFGPSAGITVLGVPCNAPGSHAHAKLKWDAAVQAPTTILCRLRRLPDGD